MLERTGGGNVRVSISGMIMLQERRPRHSSGPLTSCKCHSIVL